MEKLTLIIMILSLFAAYKNVVHVSGQKVKGPLPDVWVENYLLRPKEKVAKLHFFIQDVRGGPNATVWEVARSAITSSSSSSFGQVSVADDLITAGPDRNSKKLGRAQGLVASSDLRALGLAMNINFVFTAGPYNGSTISVAGRNPISTSNNRELPVVGGTGVFRMARGFSISSTYSFDPVEVYGVLEFTFYVVHV